MHLPAGLATGTATAAALSNSAISTVTAARAVAHARPFNTPPLGIRRSTFNSNQIFAILRPPLSVSKVKPITSVAAYANRDRPHHSTASKIIHTRLRRQLQRLNLGDL